MTEDVISGGTADVAHALSSVAIGEDERVRHSESVNINAIRLIERLKEEGLNAPDEVTLTRGKNSALRQGSNFATDRGRNDDERLNFVLDLPAEVIDALSRHAQDAIAEEAETNDRVRMLQAQYERDTEQAEQIAEKIDRVRSDIMYMSEKSSADLQVFRSHLQQSGQWVKEHTRVMADLSRHQDKTEFELRRVQMEVARLQKMTRRIR